MCQSQRKLAVHVTRRHPFGPRKPQWVKITLLRSRTFWPSFRDIGRIVVALARCEDDAYPKGQGANQMLHYLHAAVHEARRHAWQVNWDTLDQRFHIPQRCGDASNGAMRGI